MKKTLQILLTTLCIFTVSQFSTAQTTVTVSGSSSWLGYANVFESNGTTYMFGSAWGLADIKTTLTTSTNTIKLQPNFNTYANAMSGSAADQAYWTNGAGLGNKVFEGNSYVENNTLAGQVVNFTGNVTHHNLASGYTAVAFIKGLNPATGYSTDFSVTTPLTATGVFNLSSVTAIPAGLIVQYGFTVKGLNGNPANETALGDVTVTAAGATPSTVNVTLKVDMSQQTGFTTPHVAGTFNNWSDSANALTDANADGIWETTIALAPGNYEYKFLKDSWAAGDEILTSGSSCTITTGGYTNRALVVASSNITQPTVCWASCAACSVQNATVTFKVDMSQQTGFTTPHITGTFNSWSDTANAMTDANADGIWEATIALAPGNYEYKFLKDSWAAGDESLTAGSSCTITTGGYTNRALTVGTTNMTQPTVCWASCAACVSNVPTEPMTAAPTPTRPAANVISMFSNAYTNVPVDTWLTSWSAGTLTNMQIQGNDTKKYSNLNFVGIETTTTQINATSMLYFHVDVWTPNMTQFRMKLVDFGANGVYQGTPNDDVEHELTFTPTLSGWNSLDIPLSNFTGLTTRGHIAQLIFAGQPVGQGTLYVDNVYFSNVALANDTFTNNTLKIYPNPASNAITIENESTIQSVNIYNVVGQEVKVASPNANSITLDISNLETGIYIIKSVSEGKTNTTKFVKK